MKKIFALILAVLLIASIAQPAFAEDPDPATIPLNITNNPSGTNISINGIEVKAYKLFDVTKAGSGNSASYAYYLDEDFNTDAAKEILKVYFDFVTNIDNKINVIPNENCTETNSLTMAKKFVDDGLLTGKTEDAKASGANEVAALTLNSTGYYLVVASGKMSENGKEVKSVLMMDTVLEAGKNIAIKASAPKLDKNIMKENTPAKANSFNVGDSVPFEISVQLTDMLGYSTYCLKITDTLSEGLTAPEANAITVLANGADLPEGITCSKAVNGNVITVEIPEAISLKGQKITVSYSAVLNKNALTKEYETNTVNLEYSNDPYDTSSTDTTPDVIDKVYNFDVIIDKYAGEADAATTTTKLKDAKFVLAKSTGTDADGKPIYKYYKQDDATKLVSWVSAEADAKIVTTDENGAASFEGIEAGTYYLIEKQAPVGYNMLKEPVTVTVQAVYAEDGSINTEATTNTVKKTNSRWGVTQSVGNKAGALLPSTGGIGTTLFYILGSMLVLVSGVMMVTKRRMGKK